MKAPDSFNTLVLAFYQGSHDEFDSEEAWIDHAIHFIPADQVPVLRNFLRAILSKPLSNAQLQDIWRAPGSNYIFDDKSLRTLLQMVLNRLPQN